MLITGPNIARLQETEPASGQWRIELAAKEYDKPYPLTIQFETQFDHENGRIELEPIAALGTDLQRGYVVVLGSDRVELAAEAVGPAMQVAEARTVPREFGAGDLSHAALCYRTAGIGDTISLRATRHAAAALLEANVLNTTITSVLTERGETINRVELKLKVSGKRHLETQLPAGAQIWSLLINGRATVPSIRDENVFLIPLAQATAGDLPVQVDLVYVARGGSASRWSSPHLDGPQFDLPLKNIEWKLYVPEDFEYGDFSGTLEINEASLDRPVVVQYDARTYEAAVEQFRETNLRNALRLQKVGNQLAVEGEQVAAQRALESAWHYSLADEALNEDARVQLHQIARQNAKVGLVGSRKRLRKQPGESIGVPQADAPDQQIQGFSQAEADRIQNSLSKVDNENLDVIISRIIETQEAAAGATLSLVVSMPLRGRVLSFNRAIQVEPNAEMSVGFSASQPATARLDTGFVWAGACFGVLWMVFLLVPTLGRRAAAYREAVARQQAARAAEKQAIAQALDNAETDPFD